MNPDRTPLVLRREGALALFLVFRCPFFIVRCPFCIVRCPFCIVRCPFCIVRCPFRLAPEDLVGAVAVERRINVDQVHATIRQLLELIQIVAAMDDPRIHNRRRSCCPHCRLYRTTGLFPIHIHPTRKRSPRPDFLPLWYVCRTTERAATTKEPNHRRPHHLAAYGLPYPELRCLSAYSRPVADTTTKCA